MPTFGKAIHLPTTLTSADTFLLTDAHENATEKANGSRATDENLEALRSQSR